jgi:hypothetical protein
MTRRTPLASPLAPIGHVPRYRDRAFDSDRHDPYQPAGKYAEPTRCAQCAAVYERGRWRWGSAPPDAHVATCPACRRSADRFPAGRLTLDGDFALAHRDELLRIARNEAEHEGAEHPMNRIMSVDDGDACIVISTTDVHLPQRIARALKRAHDGKLDIRYASDDYAVRARWHR